MQNNYPLQLILLSLTLALGACQTADPEVTEGASLPSDLSVDFVHDIAPEIEIKCLECHNSREKHKYGGLDLETRSSALTTGNHAPIIVPGNGEGSYLVRVLRLGHSEFRGMPPSPDKLLEPDVEEIIRWIDEGADWPANFKLRRPDEW